MTPHTPAAGPRVTTNETRYRWALVFMLAWMGAHSLRHCIADYRASEEQPRVTPDPLVVDVPPPRVTLDRLWIDGGVIIYSDGCKTVSCMAGVRYRSTWGVTQSTCDVVDDVPPYAADDGGQPRWMRRSPTLR